MNQLAECLFSVFVSYFELREYVETLQFVSKIWSKRLGECTGIRGKLSSIPLRILERCKKVQHLEIHDEKDVKLVNDSVLFSPSKKYHIYGPYSDWRLEDQAKKFLQKYGDQIESCRVYWVIAQQPKTEQRFMSLKHLCITDPYLRDCENLIPKIPLLESLAIQYIKCDLKQVDNFFTRTRTSKNLKSLALGRTSNINFNSLETFMPLLSLFNHLDYIYLDVGGVSSLGRDRWDKAIPTSTSYKILRVMLDAEPEGAEEEKQSKEKTEENESGQDWVIALNALIKFPIAIYLESVYSQDQIRLAVNFCFVEKITKVVLWKRCAHQTGEKMLREFSRKLRMRKQTLHRWKKSHIEIETNLWSAKGRDFDSLLLDICTQKPQNPEYFIQVKRSQLPGQRHRVTFVFYPQEILSEKHSRKRKRPLYSSRCQSFLRKMRWEDKFQKGARFPGSFAVSPDVYQFLERY